MQAPAPRNPDRVLRLFVAGFALASLLTFAAAVGASYWQQKTGGVDFDPASPVAQR
jgi:hypothetical protein